MTDLSGEKKGYDGRLVALLGLIGATFLLFVGYSLGTVGGPEPFGDAGRTVAVTTLALTFGYNLGLATKQRAKNGPEFIFYAWFFGTFALLSGVSSLVSVVTSNWTVNALLSSADFREEMILVLGTMFGSIAIASGFVETARIRYLKRSFTLFSEYVGQGILFGYATVKVTGDVSIGVTISGVVVIGLVLGSTWVRNRLSSWRARARAKKPRAIRSSWP